MGIRFPLDGLTFSAVELDYYVEPPNLPEGVSEKEREEAWTTWLKVNAKWRAVHKGQFTKKQKTESLPDHQYTSTLVKRDGVYKQQTGPIGFEGGFGEEAGKLVLSVKAAQDRHFRPRGNRGQRGSKHRSTRANHRDRKRKYMLSKK